VQGPVRESWGAKKFSSAVPVTEPGRNISRLSAYYLGLSMIVMMAGLPGTGKSTLARALSQRLPCAVLDKDAIRAALFQPAHVEYSLAQDDFCQEIMLQTAAYLLTKDAGLHVVLDGRTFSRRYQRERVIEFCRQVGTNSAALECVCSEQTALRRLAEAVAQNTHPAANRTPELYRQIRKGWEPIDRPKLVIDTDANLESCVDRALHYLINRTGEVNV
jgi:predicted kinase